MLTVPQLDRALAVPVSRFRSAFRELLAGDAEPDLSALAEPAGDPGLFDAGGPTWVVHSDLAMLVGGLRALLLQMMHPLAMAGVADHSDYRDDPWGRLHRTGEFLGRTTFGPRETADASIETVRRVHRHVQGTAPDGRPYRADDPHLVEWIHIAEVDSFLRAHQRYGRRPLDPGEADRYVEEMAVIAERLGADQPPRSVPELRDRLADYRPELKVGSQARDAVRFLLAPPLPLAARPAYGLITAAAVGLLPRFARRALLLPVAPTVDPLVVRPAMRSLLQGIRWALGESPALVAAEARVNGSVAPEVRPD
jgi:uncharacterized protein (DUF2236 family)